MGARYDLGMSGPVAAANDHPTLDGKRLLIVEDDGVLGALLAEFFTDTGCRVTGPAGTVQEAISLLEGGPVDVALLDVSLEGERSYPVMDWLISNGVPFVVATGHSVLPGYRLPVEHMLRKPYRPFEAIAVVQRALIAGAPQCEGGPSVVLVSGSQESGVVSAISEQ